MGTRRAHSPTAPVASHSQELDVSLGLDLTYVPLELTWLFQVLAFLFQAIVTLMMLNMLIAMLNHTFNAYHENKDQFLIMEKYNIIKYYESKIENTKAFERMREKFAHWSGHKKAHRYEIIRLKLLRIKDRQ